ncbi:MAG: DUF2341 domain-containing protein, partial [Lutibacter sp.]
MFFKVGFVCAVLFISAYFFVSFASAMGDDNVNEINCSSEVYNCDGSDYSCQTLKNFKWTFSGYPMSSGHPSCCGDDSEEYYYNGACAKVLNSCGTIITQSGNYIIGQNILCSSSAQVFLEIDANNVVIDNPGGYTITGYSREGGLGVSIKKLNATGITIKNLIISNFHRGIYRSGVYNQSTNFIIQNNTINNSGQSGIETFLTSNSIISNNIISGSRFYGIYVSGGGSNQISNNSGSNNGSNGINVDNSSNNYGCGNSITGTIESCSGCTTNNNYINIRSLMSPVTYCPEYIPPAPTVNSFTVSPSSLCLGGAVSVSYSVTDNSGTGINRVELWRKVGDGAWLGLCNNGSYDATTCASGGGLKNIPSPYSDIPPAGNILYGIHVIDNSGNMTVENSTESVAVNSVPNAPTAFWPRTNEDEDAWLMWTDNASNETGFNVYRFLGDYTGPLEKTATTGVNENYYLDDSVLCATTYYYSINAFNSCGTSDSGGGSYTIECGSGTEIDEIAPTISLFKVDGVSYGSVANNTNGKPSIQWGASDTGGNGLDKIEIWRAPDNGGVPGSWSLINTNITTLSSGSWSDSVANGTYWYGVHAIDGANNCIKGDTSQDMGHCGGVNSDSLDVRTPRDPIKAIISSAAGNQAPVANFSFCKIKDTDIVQFTNSSTDPNDDAMTYEWDFGDGTDTSNEKDPQHNYSAYVAGAEDERFAVNQNQENKNLETEKPKETIWKKISNVWEDIENFFKNLFGKDNKANAASSWWNDDYQYRIKISFDNLGRSALTNFPILVKLNSTNFNFEKAKNNGEDIRFVESDNATELDFEREYFDDDEQQAIFWVEVPEITANSASDYIYIYYGNSSAHNGEDKTGTWDSNFVSVLHLDESSGNVQDSSSRNNDGNVNRADYTSSGKFKGAYDFQPSNSERIDIGTSGYDLAKGTFSGWLNYTGNAGYSNEFYMVFGAGRNYCSSRNWVGLQNKDGVFGYASRYDDGSGCSNDNADVGTSFTHVPNNWHFVSYSWDNNTNQYKIYIDGVLYGQDTSNPSNTVAFTWLRVGSYYDDGALGWQGKIDEARISNVARSADWIGFDYCSMNQSC